MSQPNQRTIENVVSVEGIGVHSGAPATLTFRPAEPDTGVRFRRMDLEGSPEIPVDLDHVCGTELGTTLGRGEARVQTVEHVMAALSAQGIDNVLLELSGPEPPILDGSFLSYLQILDEAGTREQESAHRTCLEIREPVTVRLDSGEFYVATPGEGLRVSATIEFEHHRIGRQFGSFVFSNRGFREEIAPARTFGFQADADSLHERGLALGASLENTVILDEDGVMNEDLRFPDEFLRHKVGDMVGDMALLGSSLNLHVVAERPSHRGNVALAKALRKEATRNGQAIVDIEKILEYLPHRFPMLLVDRIVEVESGKRIVGIKNVTINEPFFQGHFPGHPIMPGVLIIEAMGQVGGLLLMDLVEKPEDYVVYFMSLDKVKWRRPVVPGDQLVFELEMVQFRRHVCRMKGQGLVDGKVVAEAELMARIVER